MNSQPTLPMPTAPSPAYPRAAANRKVSISGFTATGVVLFITSLLVVGSGYLSLRPQLMGLRVHPYLLPLIVTFPLVVLARIGDFPVRVMAAMVTFMAMYCFSVLQGRGLPLNEIFKIGSAFVTIVGCALLVRRRGDFVAGALGLSIAVLVLAWPALQQSEATQELMEGANKNSYSLFALPAILMAGFISTRMKTVPTFIKGALVESTLPAIMVIFMSANRSGYLGTVLVGLMLFWDRRGRGTLLVGTVTVGIIFWMVNYAGTEVFDERMKSTVEEANAENFRIRIIWACMAIAVENPVIGISPSELSWEIGRKLNRPFVDAHNVFGHVAAGSGLICFAAMLGVGWTLYFWHPRNGRPITSKEDPLFNPRLLMRMLIILWVVRGTFSREILYNPAFCIAIGLTIGLCLLAETAREQSLDGTPSAPGRGTNAA